MDEAAANRQRTLEFFAAMNRSDADAIADTYATDGRLRTMGNTLISGTLRRPHSCGGQRPG